MERNNKESGLENSVSGESEIYNNDLSWKDLIPGYSIYNSGLVWGGIVELAKIGVYGAIGLTVYVARASFRGEL